MFNVFSYQVMQSWKFALEAAVMDVSLVWDLPKEVSVTVLSPPIISVFQGQRSLVYAQLSGLVREVLGVACLGFFMYACKCAGQLCGVSTVIHSSVTFNCSLVDELYQNKICFTLKPAEDNR